MLSESVGARLRRGQMSAQTVQVQIKSPDLKVISRQTTLRAPTASTKEIYQAAMEIARRAWDMRRPVRMLSLGCTHLSRPGDPVQISLFEGEDEGRHEKQMRLESTVDAIRRRFGSGSVSLGRTLQNDLDGRNGKG